MESSYRQELGQTRKLLAKEKEGCFWLAYFWGWGGGPEGWWQGSYLAYYLTSVDQEIPD